MALYYCHQQNKGKMRFLFLFLLSPKHKHKNCTSRHGKMARTKYCGGSDRIEKSLQTWEGWDSSDDKDNESQDDDLRDNDSHSVDEMHVANVIDTNTEAQRMANDGSMGMIEVLPLWDRVLFFFKRTNLCTNKGFTAT